MGDTETTVATEIKGETSDTLVVTDAMADKYLKVVVTDADGNTAEAKTTAAVEEVVITPVVTDVEQIAANKIAVVFDIAAKDYVNKDNLTVERVDGKAVLPVIALEWSEDGTEATATLSTALEDKVDYQVSYDEGAAVGFTASVGKVASIAVLTASAEQNITTPVKFALYDENFVDITSAIDVDTTCTVDIDGVDGATVTANTSKPSAATVQMTTVGDKATVTVTYLADEAVEPGTAIIECTAPTATIGTARFKAAGSNLKIWEDGSYCAKFYTGSDDTIVKVPVGATKYDVFFCAEDENEPGTIISYDAYEIGSSNDDVMSATATTGVDTGKYCQIEVSGNTVGTANVLVKATKNGAAYTYTIPVQVIDEVKLIGLTVSASRPTMSNAIDKEYYGTLTVTGKYSDGSTAKITDFISEVADKEKNNKLSNNLLSIYGEKQDDGAHGIADLRGAKPFTVDGAKYTAAGAQGKTYTISVTATSDDGKELKANTSVKVEDLSTAAWDLGGKGAKMEYSMEFTKGTVLTESETGTTTTTAKLAAYADKKFAGYVREGVTIGENVYVAIGDNVAIAAREAIKALKVEDGDAGTIYFKAVTPGDDANAWTIGLADVVAPTKAVVAEGHTWKTVTGSDVWMLGTTQLAGTTATYGHVTAGDEDYYRAWEEGDGAHYVLAKNGAVVATPSGEAKGSAGVAANPGDEGTWTTVTAATVWTVAGEATPLAAAPSTTYTQGGEDPNFYYTADEDVTSGHYVLVDADKKVVTPTAAETGSEGNPVGVKVDATAKKITIVDGEETPTVAGVKEVWGDHKDDAQTGDKTAEELFDITEVTTEQHTQIGFDEITLADGNAEANEATTIMNVYAAVKYGNKYGTSGELYDSAANITLAKDAAKTANAGTTITLDAEADEDVQMVVGKPNLDGTLAKPGTYTATFFFSMGMTETKPEGTAKQAESTVTVKNGYAAPTVKVTKRELDSLDTDEVQKALKINCDMNNNESEAASFDKTVWKNDSVLGVVESEADSSKWTATYVGVIDQGIQFVVPINTTFTTT